MQSIRELPKSCIQKVKETCLFYVQKVSGDYVDNKAAARYVHHLAEEVIAQLAGVAEEIKRNRTDPELFQALINEWNAYFPKTLQSMGSPKHIAMLLKQQEHEIQKLKNELDNVQRKRYGKYVYAFWWYLQACVCIGICMKLTYSNFSYRDNDIQELLRSMDNQLSVYKQSVLTEREEMARRNERILESHRREMRQIALLHDERVRELQREQEGRVREAKQVGAGEMDRVRGEFEGRIREMKREHVKLVSCLNTEHTMSVVVWLTSLSPLLDCAAEKETRHTSAQERSIPGQVPLSLSEIHYRSERGLAELFVLQQQAWIPLLSEQVQRGAAASTRGGEGG
ncbi:hypothetical protein EON64_09855 [archaeon]|nr:MAG: hypothetical protein EON64_09855 [archaeon]